ncbi:MAG: glycosyltransferase involved in cell wall biosynthesis [Crocinitomicaceae bacterium]|jgi:glycosyltransferase involved in cell wall biosynthesis
MEEKTNKIAVVIPAYKVKNKIAQVLNSIQDFVSYVIVVDDCCPQESGKFVESQEFSTIQNLEVIFHEENKGVGGAVITGYKRALELECDVIVKVDGDGQMDLDYLTKLIAPILAGEADYTKGNRFVDFKMLRKMPKIRLIGNSVLSFVLKAVSGYWHIMDPTNGYTAINGEALANIHLKKLSERYFFESDMLINLNIHRRAVKDVPIPARYDDEESSLSVTRTLFQFPFYLIKGFSRRIFLKYYIYDFNMASIYLLFGLPLLIWGMSFGIYQWWWHVHHNLLASTGTVMLAVLPLILGTQFLLQAIQIDMQSSSNPPK